MAGAILRNAQKIVKFLTDARSFDRVMKNVEVVSAGHGKCVCELTLDETHLNRGGTLHGGLTATLVDSVSTVAIVCAEKPPGVSVDMNITYLSPAKEGDRIKIEAQCLKVGKTLAFATVDISNMSNGERLIAQGRHTKHIAQ